MTPKNNNKTLTWYKIEVVTNHGSVVGYTSSLKDHNVGDYIAHNFKDFGKDHLILFEHPSITATQYWYYFHDFAYVRVREVTTNE